MEYGSNSEDDHSIRQDFPAYGSGSSRDWFAVDKFAADDSSDLMDASPPAANGRYYDHENVRLVSDSRHHHQNQQQQNYAQPQTLEIGIGGQIEREHMFDKVVTPSDVGKLNRLVIPKQHAEKFFPLDASSNEKGLLLNFEDLSGKSWRFRYSYWNSSQSYVMTKGWSRFVKEKKLDAGDIVSFQRGLAAAEKHHLFIDWRRRPITTLPIDMSQFYRSAAAYGGATSWTPLLLRPPPNRINFQTHNPGNHFYSGYGGANYMGQVVTNNASVVYLTSPEGIGIASGRGRGAGEKIPVVFESSPVVQVKKVANKSLRLFGVNMECPVSSDTSTSDEFKILLSSMAIPVNSSTPHLNQHPSSSTLLLPSSTRMYSGAPVSNKGKTSMSLNLDI